MAKGYGGPATPGSGGKKMLGGLTKGGKKGKGK